MAENPKCSNQQMWCTLPKSPKSMEDESTRNYKLNKSDNNMQEDDDSNDPSRRAGSANEGLAWTRDVKGDSRDTQ